MVGHDPYGSPSAIGARTTRPQDLKWVADPNNARSYEEMKQAASTVESQVNQLKLVVHKALGGGDFDAALKARKELEGEWWDTKEQMESHKKMQESLDVMEQQLKKLGGQDDEPEQ